MVHFIPILQIQNQAQRRNYLPKATHLPRDKSGVSNLILSLLPNNIIFQDYHQKCVKSKMSVIICAFIHSFKLGLDHLTAY